MKKYKNWGIDMGGLSLTDPVKYRKINYILTDKGITKEDFLDKETVPLESVHDLVDDGPTAEDAVNLSELKTEITKQFPVTILQSSIHQQRKDIKIIIIYQILCFIHKQNIKSI